MSVPSEVTRAPWSKPVAVTAVLTPSQPPAEYQPPPSSHASLPQPPAGSLYQIPTRQITTPAHLTQWKHSEGYAEIVAFILALNDSVRSRPSPVPADTDSLSEKVRMIVTFLRQAREWIATIPPIKQSMRFGNRAYRTWHRKMIDSIPAFLSSLLGGELTQTGAAAEVSVYLDEAFGNVQRIDYGTGHELNFVLFLCCLNKLSIVSDGDWESLVTAAFTEYITLMETVQLAYWLEPAGSKGSWGLDDYQFLCFLFGSSQLVGNEIAIEPSTITDQAKIAQYCSQYLYLQAILFIHKYKTGPFHEHSALLHSLTTLASWSKINSGLVRMYEAEVMNKFPIVQHVKFGSLIAMKPFAQGRSKLADNLMASISASAAIAGTGPAGKALPSASLPLVPKFDGSDSHRG